MEKFIVSLTQDEYGNNKGLALLKIGKNYYLPMKMNENMVETFMSIGSLDLYFIDVTEDLAKSGNIDIIEDILAVIEQLVNSDKDAIVMEFPNNDDGLWFECEFATINDVYDTLNFTRTEFRMVTGGLNPTISTKNINIEEFQTELLGK